MRRMNLPMSTRLSSLALAALATLGLGGCTTDPGSLVIPFSIGAASVTCDGVGVDKVEMHLIEISEEGSADPVTYDAEAPCVDGQVEFSGIAVGNYELEVRALASDGVTVFDNEDPSSLKKVEALEGQTVTTETVELTPTPAQILVRWDLKQAGFSAQCANVMTQQFEVSLFTADGVSKLLTAEPIACDAPADVAPGYHLVPDPDRKIDGTQVGTIQINPQDAMGNDIGTPIVFDMLTPPGRGRSVKVTVSCDDDVCVGTLDA